MEALAGVYDIMIHKQQASEDQTTVWSSSVRAVCDGVSVLSAGQKHEPIPSGNILH